MVDPRLYETEHYVLLETDQSEQILSAAELSDRLQTIIATDSASLPPDALAFDSPAAQARHIMETMCELDLGPGKYVQWFAIRLEK